MSFRVEFNNIFNRMALSTRFGGAVNALALVNFSSPPTRFSTGANTGLYSGGFGTFNLLSGIGGQRTGTCVLRIQV